MQVSLCWWSVNCCVQACKQTQRDTQGTKRAKCAHVGDTNNRWWLSHSAMMETMEEPGSRDVLRPTGQKQPPQGTRPGILKEPAAQVRASMAGYVAAGTLLLGLQLIAGDDVVVDQRTSEFLLLQTFLQKKKEEKEKEEVEVEAEKMEAKVVSSQRAQLFRVRNGAWKERSCDAKLLFCQTTDKVRFYAA